MDLLKIAKVGLQILFYLNFEIAYDGAKILRKDVDYGEVLG